jgi:hypothetical protein
MPNWFAFSSSWERFLSAVPICPRLVAHPSVPTPFSVRPSIPMILRGRPEVPAEEKPLSSRPEDQFSDLVRTILYGVIYIFVCLIGGQQEDHRGGRPVTMASP